MPPAVVVSEMPALAACWLRRAIATSPPLAV
jgi:hypothetical protein